MAVNILTILSITALLSASGATFLLKKKSDNSEEDRDYELLKEICDNLIEITGESKESIEGFLNSVQNKEEGLGLKNLLQIQIIFKKIDINTVDRKVIIYWMENDNPKQRLISMKTDFDNLNSEIRKQFITKGQDEIQFILYNKKHSENEDGE